MAKPSLKIVREVPVEAGHDPDEELTFLFAEEAKLLAKLAELRSRLPAVRDRYAAKHGLKLMLPGIPTLRTLFGPKGRANA